MMKTIYIFSLFICISSCKQTNFTDPNINPNPDLLETPNKEDLLLERTNPSSLDLNNHQLYIDTTRTSFNYERIALWNYEFRNFLKDSTDSKKVSSHDLKDFPRRWISLKKYNGHFVIYDPCDGYTPAYELTDKRVIFYPQHEPWDDQIIQVTSGDSNHIELILASPYSPSNNVNTELSIHPTSIEFVYKLVYNRGQSTHKEFVIPIEKITAFDLIVNHCPKTKRSEFNGFEN